MAAWPGHGRAAAKSVLGRVQFTSVMGERQNQWRELERGPRTLLKEEQETMIWGLCRKQGKHRRRQGNSHGPLFLSERPGCTKHNMRKGTEMRIGKLVQGLCKHMPALHLRPPPLDPKKCSAPHLGSGDTDTRVFTVSGQGMCTFATASISSMKMIDGASSVRLRTAPVRAWRPCRHTARQTRRR